MLIQPSFTKVISLFIFLLALFLLTFKLVSWLKPESSPYSRMSTHSLYNCMDCHGQGANATVDDWTLDCSKASTLEHPSYAQKCTDLQSYFIILGLRKDFQHRYNASGGTNPLISAEKLARENYCFQCHGELGQGGVPNQDALKAYIPGYFGNDFKILTQNGSQKAIHEWLTTGTNSALVDDPIWGFIAAYFIQRQNIKMPSFTALSAQEIELLTHYVKKINELGPLDKSKLKQYKILTQSSRSHE